jgi:uncharacterized protein
MSAKSVIDRRRAEREQYLDRAREFATGLQAKVMLRAAVVFGSVARGDFNRWSDIDVLVVADEIPLGAAERLDVVAPWPAGIQPVVWTPAEWREQLARRNAIAVESLTHGIWLVGSSDRLV